MPAPPPSLYQRILAKRYQCLPNAVQVMHAPLANGVRRVSGRCQIHGASHPLAWLCARLAGLPRAQQDAVVSVSFHADGNGEYWRRRFGAQHMESRQWQRQAQLLERVGPTRFVFDVIADGAGLQLVLVEFFVLGLPIPRRWHPQISAREFSCEGRFHFDVKAAFPGLGLLVHYCGYLEHEAE